MEFDRVRSSDQQAALLELLRVAEWIPEDRLHMAALEEKADCGTARCLLGWAVQNPELRKRFLAEFVAEEGDKWAEYHMKNFHRLSKKAEWIFGLSEQQAEALFGHHLSRRGDPHKVGKNEVVDRVVKLVVGLEIEPYKAANRPGGLEGPARS